MSVYNAVETLDPKVAAYLMATVEELDAGAAYNALVCLTQLVSSATPAVKKLSAAASTFIKDGEGTSASSTTPIPAGRRPAEGHPSRQ